MTRMVRANNEYEAQGHSCSAGTFNALLESLSGVHPKVLIIPSFRLMMQEISTEKDPIEFVRQVERALSYLGPDAIQDQDYMRDIEAFAEACIYVIEYDRDELKAHPESERGFARQQKEIDRLQALRHKANGKPLKGHVAKRNKRQTRIALEKRDDLQRDLPQRVGKQVAQQDNRIRLLRGLTSHFQPIEAR